MPNLLQRLGRYIPRRVKAPIKRIAFSGNQRYCPICGGRFRRFLAFGDTPGSRCPVCDSLERHRMLWRYLEEKTDFFQVSGRRMLHFAVERCFEPHFRRQVGSGYLTADLYLPADVKVDITDIQFPDDTFDIVYCSHVLQEVPDDRKAMREMCRVLKPTGFAIIIVSIPAERTVEDPTITDPEEKLRRFSFKTHVRRYGRDFVDRLREAGFDVSMTRAEDFLSDGEIERMALPRQLVEIFHCTKARRA